MCPTNSNGASVTINLKSSGENDCGTYTNFNNPIDSELGYLRNFYLRTRFFYLFNIK